MGVGDWKSYEVSGAGLEWTAQMESECLRNSTKDVFSPCMNVWGRISYLLSYYQKTNFIFYNALYCHSFMYHNCVMLEGDEHLPVR